MISFISSIELIQHLHMVVVDLVNIQKSYGCGSRFESITCLRPPIRTLCQGSDFYLPSLLPSSPVGIHARGAQSVSAPEIIPSVRAPRGRGATSA